MRSFADPNHDPAQTFFVLLRMVTPIDHFPLIFKLGRTDYSQRALPGRNRSHGRNATDTVSKNQDIAIDFKLLIDAGTPSSKLPLGKPFTRFCELENRAERWIFLPRTDLNARKYRS
ncbi:hypothetical protein [Mesorhizobium sp. Mes31]|uniref:hypothetical protein n=1 Tax=Mesorhizobium sp. Mes31 TaxID=2926017 RepID=UPI0021198EFC|nr:hypothetical protein [Mesorhizobium sp. Mes31]